MQVEPIRWRGEALELLDAAPRGVAAVFRRRRLLRSRQAQMSDQHLDRNPARDVERVLGFGHGMCPRVGIDARDRQRSLPAPGDVTLSNRCVDAMQLETRLRQPLLQIGDSRWVVIIEMGARREDLDGLETMRRDLDQVIPAQPQIVVEVR